MNKEPTIECSGTVVECCRNEWFKVKLDDSDHIIDAYIAGNMRKFQIRVLLGDKVLVEISPYDMSKGRIRFRDKTIKPPAP